MVQLGSENETTEFKKDLGQLDKGILSLTAMINRHNRGTVYFGVDDDGTVVGVKPALTISKRFGTTSVPRCFHRYS